MGYLRNDIDFARAQLHKAVQAVAMQSSKLTQIMEFKKQHGDLLCLGLGDMAYVHLKFPEERFITAQPDNVTGATKYNVSIPTQKDLEDTIIPALHQCMGEIDTRASKRASSSSSSSSSPATGRRPPPPPGQPSAKAQLESLVHELAASNNNNKQPRPNGDTPCTHQQRSKHRSVTAGGGIEIDGGRFDVLRTADQDRTVQDATMEGAAA